MSATLLQVKDLKKPNFYVRGRHVQQQRAFVYAVDGLLLRARVARPCLSSAESACGQSTSAAPSCE